jgi:competence protein F
MIGAFSLSHDVPAEGSRLLLVDDVLTTGATLVAAADTLALTAPESLTALVLAVDE